MFYILAVFYPIEESIRMRHHELVGIGTKFVGLSNYIDMFHDKVFFVIFQQSDLFSDRGCHAVIHRLAFCNPAYIYDKRVTLVRRYCLALF
ncbi:MAG: hypothetical protein ACLVJO_01740 [[Clostridium] scindens]